MELENGERGGGGDDGEGLEGPGMGVIEEGVEFYPAGGDIGGGQGMDIVALGGLSAVVDGIDLPEAGSFPFLA
jgi:hypothetical protein